MTKKHTHSEEHGPSRFELFLIKYQQPLLYAVIGILVVVAGYVGWQRFILQPQEEEAQALIFQAQIYFENDSLQKAIYGDSVNYGFLDIADDYGMTETGNLAKYYSGVSLLKLGDYEQAIEYLEDFDTDSKIFGPFRLGALGDAHAQLEEYNRAASYYRKAAKESPNQLTSPYFLKKAGLVLEQLEEYEDAIELFKKLREEYPETQEASDAEKYIARLEARQRTSS